MSKKNKRRPTARAEPKEKRSSAWLCSPAAYDTLVCQGYTSLAQNPEICAAVDTIARLVASMTIHLMENTPDGDVRIRNQLSRKVDIDPNPYMSRFNFVHWIVKTMLLGGNGNAVVYPRTEKGYLEELIPIPPSMVSFIPDGWGYKINVNGREYDPSEMLHFAINPDENSPWLGTGYRVALTDVAHNLKQAAATEKGFLESKYMPSIIVKVDALTDEFSSPAGRKKLLDSYIETSTAGEPWLIPAEQFSVEQVKPLTLADLAIADVIKLDKQTAAAILGVPAFVVGVGDFKRDAWNNFISAKLKMFPDIIQQELTKKLLYKPEWYFRFNARSLYNYDLKDMIAIALDMHAYGVMDGNEARDWAGLTPREGLDELVILENYIPRTKVADQKKLNGGGE